MTVQEVPMSTAAKITFSDGVCARIALVATESKWGARSVTFASGDTPAIVLHDAADVSQTSPVPRIFLVQGTRPDQVATVGGIFIYWIRSNGTVVASEHLHRVVQDEEYWSTSFVEIRQGFLIIYEAGILLLASDLRLVWHREKLYDDRFRAVTVGSVVLERGTGEELHLPLWP
ncbi:MAG: hypothetical protein WCP86_08270 [bacterium]